MRRIFAISTAAALLISSLPACSSLSEFFSGGSNHRGPAQVNDLVASIERVYVNSELSKDRVQEALTALQTLTSPNFRGDPVEAYQVFVAAVNHSEKQAEKLRGAIEPMKRTAGPVFEKWSQDLASYTNSEMRHRSQARLTATRERYQAIVAAVDPAQATYDLFNKHMNDHVLFMSHDLNPAALSEVQAEVRSMARLSGELDGAFDACLVAARAYVDSAALPTVADPATEKAVPVSDKKPTMAGQDG